LKSLEKATSKNKHINYKRGNMLSS